MALCFAEGLQLNPYRLFARIKVLERSQERGIRGNNAKDRFKRNVKQLFVTKYVFFSVYIKGSKNVFERICHARNYFHVNL